MASFVSTASTWVEVEADNEEEAQEIAEREVYATLCHQCSDGVELSGDWDFDSVEELDNE